MLRNMNTDKEILTCNDHSHTIFISKQLKYCSANRVETCHLSQDERLSGAKDRFNVILRWSLSHP